MYLYTDTYVYKNIIRHVIQYLFVTGLHGHGPAAHCQISRSVPIISRRRKALNDLWSLAALPMLLVGVHVTQ